MSADRRLPSSLAPLAGDYEIVRELGRGGTAVVYLARERKGGREVAIKLVRARYVGDEESLARFAREARLLGRLRHPRIVGVRAVRPVGDESIALVMERVPGRTLRQLIRDQGRLPPEQAERLLRDVAEALAHAHAHGVVHRDVKPENIFVDERDGRALLADFGIARSIHGETVTLTGMAIGTPTYMSPEQIDSADVDPRSDLYSLGVVAWEMLAGRRPWDGESLYSVIYRQKHDYLEPLDSVRDDVPERLLSAIEGLLEKDPAERVPSATALLEALDAPVPRPRRPPPAPMDSASETLHFRRPRPEALAPVSGVAAATAGASGMAAAAAEPALAGSAPPPAGAPRQVLPRASAWRFRTTVGVTAVAVIGMMAIISARFQRSGEQVAPREKSAQQPAHQAVPTSSTAVAPGLSQAVASGQLDSSGAAAPLGAPVAAGGDAPAVVAMTDPERPSAAEQSAPPEVHPSNRSPAISSIVPPLRTVADGAIGTLGSAAPGSGPPSAPAAAPAVAHFAIVAGGVHSCGLSDDGRAYCWGANADGQLGSGGTSRSSTPVAVGGDLRFTALAPGMFHSCGIVSSGAAYCWGENSHGQLGNGGSRDTPSPSAVAGGHLVRAIAAGAAHSCALDRDGRPLCWGDDAHGQLGDGGSGEHDSPVAVSTSLHFSSIAAGWNHSCAIEPSGRAWCWGANDAGQLGDGTRTDRRTPVPVAGDLRFVALAGGSEHSCGVTTSGEAYCWGSDQYGQLGDGGGANRLTPVRASARVHLTGIATGGVHSCALADDGTAYCWGRNSYGQLGDGGTSDHATPTPVSGGHRFATLHAFGAHSCGTTTTGESFCWGYNLEGQLGDGTRTHRTRPTYVEKPAG